MTQSWILVFSQIAHIISDFVGNVGYTDNDLSDGCVVKTNTAYECFELCLATLGCKGLSWASSGRNYCPKGCWMKSKMENKSVKNGMISGLARGK